MRLKKWGGVLLKNKDMLQKSDLTGKVFGKLTVIKLLCRNKHSKYVWLCKCDCGNEKEIVGSHITCGETISCGCAGLINGYIHGFSNKSEYHIWANMKERCLNKNNKAYKNYGGR